MNWLQPGDFADDAGRYELESRIATGGMGVVWRARDTVLDRAVAIKVLKPEYADDRLFRTRFETEARHAGALHHPGIASVFDYGSAAPVDGSRTPRPFLVMELVEGQPLSALLESGRPLDAEVARDLLAQAADAIGVAHARGIVHRDVKPANLLVTPDRRVKVTDFGIARAAEGMALTEAGQVLGTPSYLSPEQAQGETSTAASDVYSLGVVAFECLAGRRPFVADTAVATAIAHLRQPVPPLPDSVPADLAAVVRRALAKDPAERFADGAALAAALRGASLAPTAATTATAPLAAAAPAAAVAGEAPAAEASAPPTQTQVLTPPPGRRSSGGVPWALVIGIAAIVLALLLALWLGSRDTEQPDADPSPRQTASESPSPTDSPTETPTDSPTATDSPSETPTEEPSEPEVETVEVVAEDYIGRDEKDVTQELRDLGLDFEKQKLDNPGDQEEGIVVDVTPTGTLEVGQTVTVSYWGKPPNPNSGNGGGDQ